MFSWSISINCVANGKILREDTDSIWVQPAGMREDIGAALALWHIEQGNKRSVNSKDDMRGSYLGRFTQEKIEEELKSMGANFETLKYEDVINKTADYLSDEKAIGWFQGRMEFGPRALGGRSIFGILDLTKCKKI